jgi:hypothetical protein
MTVSVHLHADQDASTSVPHSIGSLIQIRPMLHAVVGIPKTDYERVWILATSGQLKYVRVAFTEPRRNSALVVSAQFSNKSEDGASDLPNFGDANGSRASEAR